MARAGRVAVMGVRVGGVLGTLEGRGSTLGAAAAETGAIFDIVCAAVSWKKVPNVVTYAIYSCQENYTVLLGS